MKTTKKLLLSLSLLGTILVFSTSATAACKVHLGDFDWD
ncbi:MAG TPA: glycine/betaine ABC transporter substrate-binding protein, partial [Deltaproteobacteria bacterium]|nr:glycine/betaine ABC transporter substrate-binding protein [Deltaproteobacteria bacterium]